MDESLPLLFSSISRQESHYPQDDIVDPAFRDIIQQAEQAIGLEIYPKRIKKGSSGSYFVTNSDEVGIKKYFKMSSVFDFAFLKGRCSLNRRQKCHCIDFHDNVLVCWLNVFNS